MKYLIAALILLLTLPGVAFGATPTLITVSQNYIGVASDTKPTGVTIKPGSIFTETDTGRKFIYNGSAWSIQTVTAVVDTVTLRAPAYTAALSPKGYSKITWYFNVSGISTSVTMALYAKKGSGTWTPVGSDSTVYSADGPSGITWTSVASADSIKGRWISEAGGTAAVITSVFGLSGGQ